MQLTNLKPQAATLPAVPLLSSASRSLDHRRLSHHVPSCLQSPPPGSRSLCRFPPGPQTPPVHLRRGQVQELEEHRRAIRSGHWRRILLQHEQRVCRALAAYASFPMNQPRIPSANPDLQIQSPANNPPNLPTPLPPQLSTPSSPGSATSEPNRSLPANMLTRSSPSPRPSPSRQTQGP